MLSIRHKRPNSLGTGKLFTLYIARRADGHFVTQTGEFGLPLLHADFIPRFYTDLLLPIARGTTRECVNGSVNNIEHCCADCGGKKIHSSVFGPGLARCALRFVPILLPSSNLAWVGSQRHLTAL